MDYIRCVFDCILSGETGARPEVVRSFELLFIWGKLLIMSQFLQGLLAQTLKTIGVETGFFNDYDFIFIPIFIIFAIVVVVYVNYVFILTLKEPDKKAKIFYALVCGVVDFIVLKQIYLYITS